MIDFCLNETGTLLRNDIDLVLQQIDMLFDTEPNEVIGEKTYGCDLTKYVWDPLIGANTISSKVKSIIEGQCDLRGYTVDVNTYILDGTRNDIILVQITLSKAGGDGTYKKTYKIGESGDDTSYNI